MALLVVSLEVPETDPRLEDPEEVAEALLLGQDIRIVEAEWL